MLEGICKSGLSLRRVRKIITRKKEGGRGCRLLHVRDKKEGEKNVVKS
jgi:hypothetical protein